MSYSGEEIAKSIKIASETMSVEEIYNYYDSLGAGDDIYQIMQHVFNQ